MLTFATLTLVILFDQATKWLAERGFLLSSWIDPARNPDLALGILGGEPIIEILAGATGLWIGWLVLRRYQVGWRESVAVGLAIGGAAANLLDRVLLGEVRDFIVGPKVIFNLADVALFAGLVTISVLRARSSRTGAT